MEVTTENARSKMLWGAQIGCKMDVGGLLVQS